MAHSKMVAPPADGAGRAVAALDRMLTPLENIFNLLAAFSILFLMLLAVTQILGRALFDLPIPGFIDFVEQAMVMFAFLGVAYCQRENGHIRMDLVLSRITGRSRWITELITSLLIIFLIGCLIYGSWLHFERSWNIGDSTIDVSLPTWPSKLAVPVTLALLSLRMLIQILGFLRLSLISEAEPVGVPLIESVAEHASHEIEEVMGDDLGEESDTGSRKQENGQ